VGGGVGDSAVGCAGDIPHCDRAAGEGCLDTQSDSLADGIIFLLAAGSDVIDPFHEAFVGIVGDWSDVGQIEMRMGIDQRGHDEPIAEGEFEHLFGKLPGFDLGIDLFVCSKVDNLESGWCGLKQEGGGFDHSRSRACEGGSVEPKNVG